MKLIEHDIWLPTKKGGIDGQRIAVVGYSHHRRNGTRDHCRFTLEILKRVLAGEYRSNPFFSRIPRYFDRDDPADFWPYVMFFNFLPDCVGFTDEKYATGSAEQIARGRDRFHRILSQHRLDKVFVFTKKGWNECPDTEGPGIPLNPRAAFPEWAKYAFGPRKVIACGFTHPQFAKIEKTRTAVRTIMRMKA